MLRNQIKNHNGSEHKSEERVQSVTVSMLNLSSYSALIFDLDGVITQTANLHARAWRMMFDEYLQWRKDRGKTAFAPYRDGDYTQHLDGRPRYEGVDHFLTSRDIDLPWGDPEDPPGMKTVCGLGNRKNQIFHDLLRKQGADVYEDGVLLTREMKTRGLPIAVVSSSRNCRAILDSAGLTNLFDVRVDGVTMEREGLKGKPDPDIFLRAAELLGVDPARAVVFEDAIAGVEAGKAG
ncbi:MAG: beta-phosphoglucomutase family hydrolase, partial [Desulfovibrionales bacterium]